MNVLQMLIVRVKLIYEPPHDKTNKKGICAQRRLWSDWADAQAVLSLRLAHSHFVSFVMRRLICEMLMTVTMPWKKTYKTIDQILSMAQVWRELNSSCENWYEPRYDKTNKMSVRPAKTQISLGIRPVWAESSLSAWRKLGSLATH